MKFILIFTCSLLLTPMSALAAQGLKCIPDDRPKDGNMVAVDVKQQPGGTYDLFYSAARGGFGPGSGANAITNKPIAFGLKCIISKLDPRILQCSDESFSTVLSSTLVSRSELVVVGKGNVTHKVKESIEMEIYGPNFQRRVWSFDSTACITK